MICGCVIRTPPSPAPQRCVACRMSKEIIDTTHDSDRDDHSSASDADQPTHTPESPQASSSKRKKKKKSKASRIIDSLRGNEIPDDHAVTVDQSPRVASQEAEAVMQVLNQLKLMDALKGKASVTGRGKNPLGEHKVSSSTRFHLLFARNPPLQVLGHATRPSIG